MGLNLVVKLKYESNIKKLSVGIKYSVCDLLFDVNLICLSSLARKLAIGHASHIRWIMSALPLASGRLIIKLWIPFIKQSFRWRFVYTYLWFPYFLFFWFQTWFYHIHWFYPHRSFKHSKWWRHKVGHALINTDLSYFCAYFIVKIDEKCSLDDCLNTI